MDPNVTRPISTAKVLYRCTCGVELQLNPLTGGQCLNCSKEISPKILGHELAQTITIHDGSFELRPLDKKTVSNTGTETRIDFPHSVSNEDAESLIGKTFGHFELISTLGRGGMAQVYRALDTSLQRYVAVKILRSGIVGSRGSVKSSEAEVDKLLQEAVSQARVTHPNIVTIYFVGKQDGDPFLAMELINGTPLSTRIAEGNIPFSEIVSIARQLTDALEFSYELDILHGDIKPTNILLQSNGVAKLSDFGMARRVSLDSGEATGGTPNYIAPELLNGKKPTIQSDIYALGVTMYEMSFGHLPLELSGTSVIQWQQIHSDRQIVFPLPWPDRLPEAWKNLLEKMLAKNPEERHETYSSLITELNQLSPGSQVTARIFPRFVAASIDWITVMIVAISLQLVLGFEVDNRVLTNTLRTLVFAPIVIYTLVVYVWRQSLGRSLMHIRVINRYGLTPTSYRMGFRSLMRMQFAWFAISLSMFDNAPGSWLGVSILILVAVAGLVLLFDIIWMASSRKRRSLHDLIAGTRVVLDTHD